MANTYITTNTINAGAGFTFAATGDALVVLPNVTLGSTSGVAIAFGGLTDLEVTVLGTVVGPISMVMGANSGFTVGLGGTVVSLQPSGTSAALQLAGGLSQVTIDGSLLGTEGIGILAGGGGNIISVTGSVTSGSGGVFMGLFGSSGDVLVNSGTIRSGDFGDASFDTRFNNGVFAEGANSRITNLAGGEIIAVSSQGAGVRLGLGANLSVVTNAGSISASVWYAVDFAGMGVAEVGRLTNTGVIQGIAGAFNGNDATDVVTNSGTMIGNVLLWEGNDRLDGRGGTFRGLVDGGIGDDRLDFRGGGLLSDAVYGGEGFDTILGTGGDDTLYGGFDSDDINGGAGDDSLYGSEGGDTVQGGAGDDHVDGGSGFDYLYGGLGDDFIRVDNNSEAPPTYMTAYGGAGDDTITGGLQGGVIYGGDGDDDIYSGNDEDYVAGGRGDDVIDLSAGIDFAAGGQGDDIILGGAGADSLDGNAGADNLLGDTENDTLNGGGGDDSLNGGANNDRLFGGNGDDLLDGADGRDNLAGGGGSDTLIGGIAADTMSGGRGDDVFVFIAGSHIGTAAASRDGITDFRAGEDQIDLSEIDANSLVAGNQAFSLIGSLAFTSVGGQLRYSAADGLLQGDTDGNGVADFTLELFTRPALTATDLLL